MSERQVEEELINNYIVREVIISHKVMNFELTVSASNPLTSGREGQGFPYRHLSDVEVMLGYVGC
jgi:hypothetical protein